MRNPSNLPHGGRGSEMLSDKDHEFVRVQFKARLERIVFPDGNQVTYFYDKCRPPDMLLELPRL